MTEHSELLYDQVRQAALSLAAAGTSPTPQMLREHLGYNGDSDALDAHLQHWQQELRVTPAAALADRVPEDIINALQQVWQLAKTRAGDGFAELRRQADSEIAEATAHRIDALAALKREQTRNDALEAELDGSRRDTAELARQLAVAEEKIAAAVRREAELTEQLATQRAEQATAAAEATARLESARIAATEHEQQHAIVNSEQRARLQHLEKRLAEQEQTLLTLRQQHRQAHEQIAQNGISLKERERQVKELQLERDSLRHRVDQQHNQLGRVQADRDISRERLAQQASEAKALRTELDESRQQGHRLDVAYAQANQEIATLNERLNELLEAGRPRAAGVGLNNSH